jgi:hypothetical protein
LGLDPATKERRASTGDIARVPPFSQVTLLNTDFEANVPLYSGDTSRPKGWRAFPLLDDLDTNPARQRGTSELGFGAKLATADPARSHSGQRHVILGLPRPSSVDLHFTKGQTAFLAQEVRSPFAGRYVMKAHVRGNGSSREFFEAEFLKHFTCRLQFFQFTTPAKIATERKELASIPFVPRFFDDGQAGFDRFELEKVFENPNPGGNFSFGLGLGAAIILEKTSDGILTVPANAAAFLRIDDVTVEFTGKARIETVKV